MAVKYTTLEGGSANFKIISSLGVLKGYVEIVQALTGRDLTITNVHVSKNTIDNRYGKYQTDRERESSSITIDSTSISQVKNKSFITSNDNRLVSTDNVPSSSAKKISNYNHSIEIVSGIDNNILTTFDEKTLKNLNNRALRAKKAINNAWSNTDKLSVEATSTVSRNGSSSLSAFFEFRPPGPPAPPSYPLAVFFYEYWSARSPGLDDAEVLESWVGLNNSVSMDIPNPGWGFPYVEASEGLQCGSNRMLLTEDSSVMFPDSTLHDPIDAAMLIVTTGGTVGYHAAYGLSSNDTPFIGYNLARTTQYRNNAGTLTTINGLNATDRRAWLWTQNEAEWKVWVNGSLFGTGTLGSEPRNFNRLAVGGLARTTFSQFSSNINHAVGVCGGTLAQDLHADPSAMFAAANEEWGTPV